MAEGAPVVEPLQISAGFAEELQLHLLELADAEDEVARGDLVAEGFTDLAHAEGQLAAGGALGIDEVGEDALRRLRPQVHGVLGILGDALERLEHQVELPDVGEVVLTAGGAGDVVVLDEVLHLLLGEGIDGLGQLHAVLAAPVLDELVGAKALLALLAVHQRIGEACQMTAGHPRLGVHEDGGVLPHVVGVLLHELLPPGLLDVVLQLHAQGTVVPCVGKAAVDLGACEDDAAVFAQRHDLIHGLFSVFHVIVSFMWIFLVSMVKPPPAALPARSQCLCPSPCGPWTHRTTTWSRRPAGGTGWHRPPPGAEPWDSCSPAAGHR